MERNDVMQTAGATVTAAGRTSPHGWMLALVAVLALGFAMVPAGDVLAFDAPPKDQGHNGSDGDGPDDDNPDDPDQDEDGDPVQVKTGNFTMAVEDFALRSFALPIVVRRSYNSLDNLYDGPFGPGWSTAYVMSLQELTEYQRSGDSITIRTVVILRDDTGINHTFTPIYSQQGNTIVITGWNNPRKHFGTLTKTANGRFTWERKDGTQFRFVDGRLDQIVDTNGNRLVMGYDGQGRLVRVENPAGRYLTYAYNSASKVASITDNIGRSVTYGYDAENRLNRVTSQVGAVTTMTYGSENRLATLTSPEGDLLLSNTYDSGGRVTSQFSNGATYTYSYFSGYTRVRDSRNAVTDHYFNDAGNPTRRRDPLGQNTYYFWDDDGNMVRRQDERGFNTTMQYDSLGNLTRIEYPDGGVKTFTYGAFSRVTSMTDQLGRVTSYTYDARGNRTAMTDAVNQTESYAYDSLGRLVTRTDKAGNDTTFGYTASGDLQTVTDSLGKTTAYTYDAVGRRLTETDPRGATTSFAYDERDRLTSMTDPLGNTVTYAYDANNDMVAETDPLGQTTSYAYTPYGFLASQTDPAGNTFTYGYDSLSNRTSVTDPEGRTSTLTYDSRNMLASVTRADGSTVAYAYDAAGNLSRVTDPNGQATTYTYDEMNRRTGSSFADGSTIQTTYNLVGEAAIIVDRKGQSFDYTYDGLDRLTRMALPSDGDVDYAYNALDRLTSVSGYAGTVTYTYDALQRLASQTGVWGQTVDYEYDADDRLTKVSRPGRFDLVYSYDDADRLVGGTAPSGTVSYTYDAEGKVVSQLLPNGVTVSYTYDAVDRLESVVHTAPDGSTVLLSHGYTYSDTSLMTSMTQADGTRTEYEYDDFYRLVTETVKDAGGTTLSTTAYTYDANGNRLSRTVDGVTTTYTYNEVDELLDDSDGRVYDYDANGNLVSATTPAGIVSFEYDDLDRLTSVSGGGLAPTTYAYDGESRRVQRTVSGVEQRHVFYGDDLLEELDATGLPTVRYDLVFGVMARDGDGVLRYLHLDGTGSTRALSDIAGDVTDSYSMDAFGVRTSTVGTTPNNLVYNANAGYYDESQVDLVHVARRYYQPDTGRFITADPFRQGNNYYAYALNNPLLYNDPTGQWVNFLIGCVAGGLTDVAIGEGISALTGEHKERSNWDRLSDFGLGCVTGAAGVGLANKLDKLNDLRRAKKQTKCCFVAGTEVKTPDGYARVEDLEVGDLVLSRDEETGEVAAKRITSIMVRSVDDVLGDTIRIRLRLGSRTEDLTTTEDHPFWVPARAAWVEVKDLSPGDELLSFDGEVVRVEALEVVEPQAVFNLAVEDFETYFVGRFDTLVHNCPPVWTPGRHGDRVRNALEHFKKHGDEFPQYKNAKQYAEGARDFVNNPPPGTLTKTRPNGDKLLYDPGTNTFAVTDSAGSPRTMFKPSNGMNYWNSQ